MTGFLALFSSFFKTEAGSFVSAHWEVLAVAIGALVYGLGVLFAPSLERPLLIAGPVAALGLGVMIGRKYAVPTTTNPATPPTPAVPAKPTK